MVTNQGCIQLPQNAPGHALARTIRAGFFNSRHSVTKMSESKHQALPEGVQRAKATLRAGRTADTLVMREVDARKAKAADTLGMPWWQMAKRVILNRKKDGLAVSLVKEAP